MNRDRRMLLPYEGKVYSQNGEDGIIKYMLDTINNKNYKSIEIGWGDGTENNTRFLLENNYHCLAFDMVEDQKIIHKNLELKLGMIDISNSLDILKWHDSPDFFSIDIDSIDWYVLRNLLKNNFQPKVICCEYNAWIGSENFGVIKTDVKFNRSGMYGASISAFNELLLEHGYNFFTVNSLGVNAFYYHNSIKHQNFINSDRFLYKDCKPKFRQKKYGDIDWWNEYSYNFYTSRLEVENFINQNL